jgi:hypothetical protein
MIIVPIKEGENIELCFKEIQTQILKKPGIVRASSRGLVMSFTKPFSYQKKQKKKAIYKELLNRLNED